MRVFGCVGRDLLAEDCSRVAHLDRVRALDRRRRALRCVCGVCGVCGDSWTDVCAWVSVKTGGGIGDLHLWS